MTAALSGLSEFPTLARNSCLVIPLFPTRTSYIDYNRTTVTSIGDRDPRIGRTRLAREFRLEASLAGLAMANFYWLYSADRHVIVSLVT